MTNDTRNLSVEQIKQLETLQAFAEQFGGKVRVVNQEESVTPAPLEEQLVAKLYARLEKVDEIVGVLTEKLDELYEEQINLNNAIEALEILYEA